MDKPERDQNLIRELTEEDRICFRCYLQDCVGTKSWRCPIAIARGRAAVFAKVETHKARTPAEKKAFLLQVLQTSRRIVIQAPKGKRRQHGAKSA